MHTLTVLLLLAMLATLATSQGSPLYFGTTMFTFHMASSPLANCICNISVTASPLNCNISNSDLTSWTLTGPTITPSNEALSPTTPTTLNPYGSYYSNSIFSSNQFTILNVHNGKFSLTGSPYLDDTVDVQVQGWTT